FFILLFKSGLALNRARPLSLFTIVRNVIANTTVVPLPAFLHIQSFDSIANAQKVRYKLYKRITGLALKPPHTSNMQKYL
ncbi:MAG: hypothetical protein ACYSSN_03035, partial [Planctomycetota bacterium]